MMILHEVDKPGSNVEEYISSLDSMLLSNMGMIKGLRKQLLTFNKKYNGFLSLKNILLLI